MSEKYPRTYHLPFSPGGTKDDRRLPSVAPLLNKELVITEKLDGSNVCLEREAVFARSHNDAPNHPSFDALKALHASLRWRISADRQVFCEWLWVRHSIGYDRLPAFLLGFGIRDASAGEWLSWDETVKWLAENGLFAVPVLWRGVVQTEAELQKRVESLTGVRSFGAEQEGVVVRVAESFLDADFPVSVAKWVRASHVQTDTHWRDQPIVRNRLV